MTTPKRYRKKPVVVEAMQWSEATHLSIQKWGAACYVIDKEDRGDDPAATGELWVAANSRWLPIRDGEWIIRDAAGYYPCRADIFEETYEPAD